MAVKSLADGHLKLVILTTKPANPLAPTVAELAAGTDISCAVLASDFTWGATDSDKVNEKPLCQENNANAIGASNYQAGLTLFRYFDETDGSVDATADIAFQTLKAKGTTVYGYLREDGKLSPEAFVAGDEATYLEVLTDTPQRPSNAGGYIKKRVPLEPQVGAEVTVAA